MYSLFQFIFRNRVFFTFVLLEIVCFGLIVNDESYLAAKFFNSSNGTTARLLSMSSGVSGYFSLKKTNEQLAEENRRLNESMMNRPPYGIEPAKTDSVEGDSANYVYEMLAAKVVNNSTRRVNNFLTINRGDKDGVLPGMGVVGPGGIAGKVKYTSSHFSTIISLLHTEFLISSVVKRNRVLGTVRWVGESPQFARLEYVPRHVELQVGDTVVTSGHNSTFPEGYLIGTISDFNISDEGAFYHISVKLATDFYSLPYVYVVKNKRAFEKDSLEQLTLNHD